MQIAQHWLPLNNKVQCLLCPHNCIISENKSGICNVRTNIKNTLYTSSYGNLCALNIDPVEKKPLYHFLPSSKTLSIASCGCNFKCANCQNWTISQNNKNNTMHNVTPESIVNTATSKHCDSISFTYTEPTIFYEFMLETSKLAKINGLKNIIVSNGFINPEPLSELCKYIDAANIDIKSFNEITHKKITGGNLNNVLNSVKMLFNKGVWLELTNLIIPDISDSLSDILLMCKWLTSNNMHNVPIHFSCFFPNYKLTNTQITPEETIFNAVKIAKESGLKYVYAGNISSDFENTYCNLCNKLLIKRNYYDISQNKIEHGKCSYCNNIIPGMWNKS